MDKTIEAESSEFSSSIEEFRRKEALEDIVQDDESLTALCAAKDGQDDPTAHAVGPINEAERERKLSPRKEEEEEGDKEVKEQDEGEGEFKDREGKEKKRNFAGWRFRMNRKCGELSFGEMQYFGRIIK